MSDKVTRLPNTNWENRKRNQIGPGFIPCEVSGRYLNVRNSSDSEYITIDVMTTITKNDKDKKLTELVVRKEDLLYSLKNTKIL